MRWILYNALFAVAYLAMMPKFLLRMKKRGGYRAHFAERFGRYDPETARHLAEKPRVGAHGPYTAAVSHRVVSRNVRFVLSE